MRTLATITFQKKFVRLYDKLAGMTGTATTSAEEFAKVYKLDVVEVPTHRNLIREDLGDIVYKTEEVKFAKIVERIKEVHTIGEPVLVGTIAIEKSEYLAALLELKVLHIRFSMRNSMRRKRISSSMPVPRVP